MRYILLATVFLIIFQNCSRFAPRELGTTPKSSSKSPAPLPTPAPGPTPAPAPAENLRLSASYTNPEVLSRWTAPFANGWFPKLSPDGKHVACGQGEVRIVDLTNEVVLHSAQRAYGPAWIRPDTATYFTEITDNVSAERHEFTIGQSSARTTGEDPFLVIGANFDAGDGHWASWIPTRLVYDNRLLVASGAGGGRIRVSGNSLVHAGLVNAENRKIQLWTDGRLVKEYPTLTPQEAHNIGFSRGYIAYGGSGPTHGIDPSGNDIDLTISPWGPEYNPEVFWVKGQPWVASTTTGPGDIGFVLLRPWGARDAIVIEDGDSSWISVTESNGIIHIARSGVTGRLWVVQIPATAKRYNLVP